MTRLRGLAYCAGAAIMACSSAGPAARERLAQHARLPQGVIARVDGDDIALATVQRIAQAAAVSLREARERASSDALFAAAARASLRDGAVVHVIERAAHARALLEGLKREAFMRGPATDAEVAQLTASRWRELDRPEAVRTTHAVALIDKPADEATARALAQRLHQALSGSTDAEEFLRRARAVSHDGVELRAERLPAITSDGRAYDPENPAAEIESPNFDLDFAKAANALGVGQVSMPVRTRFGYHVILCEARFPELRVPLEQRRQILQDEVFKGRAERAKQELLAHLSAAAPIPISRASDDLMSHVRVSE